MRIKELKESGKERKQSVEETREHLPISDAIPKRAQTADALSHERERLAAIINGTNIGTWEWNIQTGETIFNNRWAEIIGYTLDELAPVSIETWMKFAHPDDLQLSSELLERHFRGDLDYYECESRMKHKSGDWVWVLDRGKVASWTKDGKPLMMFGTHLDLTARKQAEEVLRQSEELHRTTLQTAMDGFWMADTQGRLLEVNETYSRMSGYSLEELRAMCIPDLEVVETATDTAAHMQKVMAQGEDRFETRHRRKDGSIFPIEISVQYRPIGGGRMVAFLRDITEHKLTEQTLRRQREELSHVGRLATVGEFAASIAHEIHQPLTAILNNAQAAQRFLSAEKPEITEVQEAIQDIIADDRRAA
ncbi:MAG: PAS domain S-box protein, partial [Deltaproteobacteria bacterium]